MYTHYSYLLKSYKFWKENYAYGDEINATSISTLLYQKSMVYSELQSIQKKEHWSNFKYVKKNESKKGYKWCNGKRGCNFG